MRLAWTIAYAIGITLIADATQLVTVRQADNKSTPIGMVSPSVSGDGRYVAFASYARLSPVDTNPYSDVYVLDRVSQTVTLETAIAGRASDRDSISPRISGDGHFLTYETSQIAEDNDPMPLRIVVVRDRWTNRTQVIQKEGAVPNGPSRTPAISTDGRIVVFTSCATNLVDGPDANEREEDIYSYDTGTGKIARVSVDSEGRQASHGDSFAPTLNADGRYIAFTSHAALGGPSAAGSKPVTNVYLRDTQMGTTTRVSVTSSNAVADGNSYDPALSGNGRYVAFVSDASNLAPRDDNGVADVFLFDLMAHSSSLVSRSVTGTSANGPSGHPAVSADGRIVVFQSDASDMVCGPRCQASQKDINLVSDVFVFDASMRSVACVSTGRTRWMEPSVAPAVDAAGDVIAFSSRHPIDGTDVANDFDLFVRFEPRRR